MSFFQEYKEHTDAEDIMPLPTSDFKSTICQELKSRESNIDQSMLFADMQQLHQMYQFHQQYHQQLQQQQLQQQQPLMLTTSQQPLATDSTENKNYNERGSVDSSDTYASCQTHPFYSEVC